MILSIVQLEKFEPGENIYLQGERGHKMFIVLDGQVELVKPSIHQS
jgi:CRP-like cAMP-binding protein